MRALLPVSLLALATTSCMGGPTLESIRYGYSPARVERSSEPATVSDANDAASGWSGTAPGAPAPTLYGRDGSPVAAAAPGAVVTTQKPIGPGVASDPGGSRSLMLDKYAEAVEQRDELRKENEGLQAALELAEGRARELDGQLGALQTAFDALGHEKKNGDAKVVDLAARLATAQIARLEAERALLEATLEWRRMSAANNAPLEGAEEGRP
ncbi:MAG: hypothetical protein AAFU73_00400 [Planctomycetota bacterium]